MSRNLQRRSGNSGRKMAAVIARQMAAVLPNMVAQIQQQMTSSIANQNLNLNSHCSFKHFNSCNPPKYNGADGATGLLQWYESMENTFINSDCPDHLKVRYATGTLQKRALTWWNGEKRILGEEATAALTWDTLKEIMSREFCPRNEIKKLEAEFWDLKQDSGENLAYTTRFHELSLLVPHLVTPLSRAIEKYIGGLPMQIQDTVWGRDPITLADAIRLSATLTDNHVRAGTLTRKGSKKAEDKSSTKIPREEAKVESSTAPMKNNNKRKANPVNYAVTQAVPIQQVAPTFQPAKRAYIGPLPLCNKCSYHHATYRPCRQCTNCNQLGHFFNVCRQPKAPTNPSNLPFITAPRAPPVVRACYQCGDPNHFFNACPLRAHESIVPANQVNQFNQGARGRVYNVNANQAQANNDVMNGTFLVNVL